MGVARPKPTPRADDLLGDMLSKADVGTYAYPPAGAAQPHGVSSIAGSAGTTKFTYDANGNLTTQTGATTRSLSWTIFNMPAAITYAGKTITFQYDADHHRVEQVAPEGTTYYLPDGELTPSLGAGPVWHVYVQADGQRVAETYGPTGALKHHYFHNDDQGSIGLITADGYVYGANGSIVQNELSDVFGQPRLPTGATDPSWGANDATKRRYINQEDLTDSHLIDLNARVYDPLFAKFLSPDPVIADQDDSQSWNAYAYAHNNPMSGKDPTGLNEEEITVKAPRPVVTIHTDLGAIGTTRGYIHDLAITAVGHPGSAAAKTLASMGLAAVHGGLTTPSADPDSNDYSIVNGVAGLIQVAVPVSSGGSAGYDRHVIGVRQEVEQLRSEGMNILGTEVDAQNSALPYGRRYDIVAQNPETSIRFGVEVKTSTQGLFKINQKQFDFDIATVRGGTTSRVGPIGGVMYRGVCFACAPIEAWHTFILFQGLKSAGVPFSVTASPMPGN